MNAFNPAHFRAQFPSLADAGVYLDSAATALKPLAVIDASDQFYRLSAGNVHRSQFAAAQRLTERYEAARDRVAAWLNALPAKISSGRGDHRGHQYGGAELRPAAPAARR